MESTSERRFALFRVGGRRWAVDIDAVECVESEVGWVTLPDAPNGVAGVVRVAGKPVAVVDAARVLGVPPHAPGSSRRDGSEARVVVLRLGRARAARAALAVDRIDGIRDGVPETVDGAVVQAVDVASIERALGVDA